MKSTLTKTAMILSLVGLSGALFAQEVLLIESTTTTRFDKKEFRTWSIGLNGGMLTHYTPFNSENNGDFKTPHEEWGYGGYIKKQIYPGFGIQADFLAGKIRGTRPNGLGPGATAAQQNSGFKTTIDWSAALKLNFTLANLSLNRKQSLLSPYITAGAGYMSSSANTDSPLGMSTPYTENWFVPIGAGFKIGLSKGVNLDLGYDVNFMRTNNFDGTTGSSNDRFSYAHAGLEIALGRKGTPQLQNTSPIASLREDAALESAELRKALTLAQANTLSRDIYALEMGDDDGDGVANKFDKCPGTPAGTVVDGAGCPFVAVVTEKVIITEADRKVVDDAIKNLEFDLNKATIRPSSYPTLDRVADLLKEKNFSLKLSGYTDNTGPLALNMRLSKERAEAVKAYLVAHGANASRIEAVGYGPENPIASNKTAAGRQKNRRVEFTLY
ncbi:OmpA family protein [Pedobacter sp.]|uniref:OmpA family protein n=1 Tax=Pedobacter sp. TaxID=1411316 RepID=UPI003D7F9D9F